MSTRRRNVCWEFSLRTPEYKTATAAQRARPGLVLLVTTSLANFRKRFAFRRFYIRTRARFTCSPYNVYYTITTTTTLLTRVYIYIRTRIYALGSILPPRRVDEIAYRARHP